MRIRSIKPEFWRSEDIAGLSVEDRLLFVGLWSYVDDNGVGLDRLAEVAADLFAFDLERDPQETFARVSRGLQNLSEANLIARYVVANRHYLSVSTWAKHQRIDHANKARYPGPDQAEDAPSATPSRESRETFAPGTEEQGNRGTGERKTLAVLRTTDRPSTEVARIEEKTPGRRTYPTDFEAFWTAYPRHEKKGDALKAWNAAKALAPVAEILEGARRYALDPNREAQYTQHPATWLRARGWEDEPLPARRPTSSGDRLQAAVGQMFQELGAGSARGAS